MKHTIFVVAVTFILISASAFSQMAPVKCKHMTTGEIMTIGGQSCPSGWMRWY